MVELQDDVAVLLDGISHVGVQRKDFVAGHDASVALNDQDIADGAALKAQLHLASSVISWRILRGANQQVNRSHAGRSPRG
jgi:hypothetical protein